MIIDLSNKKMSKVNSLICDIFNILISNHELLLESIKKPSSKNYKNLKNNLNKSKISKLIKELDSNIILTMDKAKIPEKLKEIALLLKISDELEKIAKKTRTLITKSNLATQKQDDKFLKECFTKIIESVLKSLKASHLIISIDSDDVNDLYNEIIFIDSKIDDIYDSINKYILDKKITNDEYIENSKIVMRNAEKIVARTNAIAALIKYY